MRDMQGRARPGVKVVAGLHVMTVGAQHRAGANRGMAAERDTAEDRGPFAGMGQGRGERRGYACIRQDER